VQIQGRCGAFFNQTLFGNGKENHAVKIVFGKVDITPQVEVEMPGSVGLFLQGTNGLKI